MLCSDCGYVCSCTLWHSALCANIHEDYHLRILAEREEFSQQQESAYPDAPPSVLGFSIFGPRRIKHCQICEEEIGVTDHKCKKEKVAIDWLDYMVKLFGDGNNEKA